MQGRSRRSLIAGALLLATSAAPLQRARAADPLADEIARWSAFLRDTKDEGDVWRDVQQSATPALARAEQSLRDGRRLLALQRLAAARESLAAAAYVVSRPPEQRKDGASFEAEWARVENYGESELAKRFGVTRYPAIFVDDVLVATPNDFGF